MSFLETPRFPDAVAYGFVGGARYNTRIVVVASGREQRNSEWSATKGFWKATHHGKSQALTDALIDFFHAVNGRAHGFRFKDFTDYRVSGSQGTLVALGGSTWQMYKTYTAGALTKARLISKPIAGAIIAGGGTYSYSTVTGIITKSAGADPTGWTGEFDVPCRFDKDELEIEVVAGPTTNNTGIYQWGDIGITEIRV